MSTPANHGGGTESMDRATRIQLAAFAGGPLAVLLSMQVKYLIVPWVCGNRATWGLHVAAWAGIALALGAVEAARRQWLAAGGGWPDDEGSTKGRSRFLAMIAMLLGGVSALVIFAQWLPDLFIDPCHR